MELRRARKRRCAPLWIMVLIWLTIAATVHVVEAIPLVGLAVFTLCAARWR
jgi:hypothetical protein